MNEAITDRPLIIPRALAIRLLGEAQKAPQTEVCGMIGADDTGPAAVYPVRNIAADTAQRFDMDPQSQIDAMKRMRARGQRLWAVYHSHPLAAARPSVQDVSDCGYPEALQLIVSLDTKGVLQLRAWDVSTGAPRERSIEIA